MLPWVKFQTRFALFLGNTNPTAGNNFYFISLSNIYLKFTVKFRQTIGGLKRTKEYENARFLTGLIITNIITQKNFLKVFFTYIGYEVY